SYANYIDGQLEELVKRYYSVTMTTAMLESYTERLISLSDFIGDTTMYGGTDTTPDVEVPGTDVGGSDTTTPGTQGGIIGDIGGGEAGSGIGGGAAPGGAGPVGPAGPSVDDGETTDPVTPDDNRRFIDVAETDWFNKAVNYVADNNYFQGVSENEFDPYGKMTRAMLVTVIGRIAKADVSQAKSDFADVEDGVWYAGYVAWAAENGIVTGVGEGKFAPNDNITREQIAAILMRYAKYKGIDVSVDSTEKYDSMKDTDKVSEYAVEALKWATANSVINGAKGGINPKGNATRAEVAQMIMNFCNTFSI
ncbi:MAG: S-layer homology domain-containing protein, partial [Clostridia bacterium]|nr:S-layer homology domain-containing protein [Clostridia bacterium]